MSGQAPTGQQFIEVNKQNIAGTSALHLAVVAGRPKVVRMILNQEGVDVNIPNGDKMTPLQVAKKVEIIRMLEIAAAH